MKFLYNLLGIACILLPVLVSAQVEIPDLRSPVVDLTAALPPQFKSTLESRLTAFSQQKGSQIAVLLVSSTKPEEIEQYSIRVVEKWRLGRDKFDDGVLLIIALNDRKLRIEVGYGLEGAISDIQSKRIIEDLIVPQLRKGDLSAAVTVGVDAIESLINGEALPLPKQSESEIDNFFGFGITLVVIGEVVYSIFGGFFSVVALILISAVIAATVSFGTALIALLFALFFLMIINLKGTYSAGGRSRGYSGWSSGGFSSSGGGFSGGGGSFGGGGASGSW